MSNDSVLLAERRHRSNDNVLPPERLLHVKCQYQLFYWLSAWITSNVYALLAERFHYDRCLCFTCGAPSLSVLCGRAAYSCNSLLFPETCISEHVQPFHDGPLQQIFVLRIASVCLVLFCFRCFIVVHSTYACEEAKNQISNNEILIK